MPAQYSQGNDEQGRFDPDFMQHLEDSSGLPGLQSTTSMLGHRLVAVATTIEVLYVGTLARHGGSLSLDGVGTLFADIRQGCAYGSCDIGDMMDLIGTARTLTAAMGDELVFALEATAFTGTAFGLASTPAARFTTTSSDDDVRIVDLGGGQLLIGFETFADSGSGPDWVDSVFRVTGLSRVALAVVGPVQSVPEPGSLPLIAVCVAAALRWRRRHPVALSCNR